MAELIRNCKKHGVDISWISDCYGAHNALADVISTVLVLKHLDLEDGLSDEFFKVLSGWDLNSEEENNE